MAENLRRTGLSLAIDGQAEFKKALADINRELKQSQSELNLVTAAYARNEQNIDTLTARKTHLENSIRLSREEQARLNDLLADATEKYGANSREVQELQTKLNNAQAKQVGLTRQLGETTNALEAQERALRGQAWTEFGQRAEAAGKKMQDVGKSMSDTGRNLSMSVTAPLVAMGTAALVVGGDYQQTMNTIQARTGMAVDAVEGLGREFRQLALSGDYGNYTAREIASAYSNIALKGHDASHATEIMRNSMVLATATGTDLSAAAYFLGAYLDKIGKDASYAEGYINLFAEANQRTGIELNTLQNYLFRANASLQAAGISGTEATAVFAQLYQAGVQGANAYSGFSQAIQGIMLPSENAQKALYDLGITNADYYVSQGRVLELLFKVTEALEEVEDSTERLDIMTTIFTQGSAQAFIDGLGDNREALLEIIPELYEASAAVEGTGRAFEMAAIKQDGLVGQGKQLRASFEEIMLQISEHLMPHAQSFLDMVNRWVERFASLDEGTQRTILKFAGLIAAIGPVLVIGGRLVSYAGNITSAIGRMSQKIGAAGGAKAYLTTKITALKGAMTAVKLKIAGVGTALTALKTKLSLASLKMGGLATAKTATAASSGILTVGLGAVTAGFKKLTAAMLANPIGLIIAGVAALAAGIAYLIIRMRRVSEEYQEMQEEAARLTARQHELTEASAAAAEQFQKNITGIEDQAEHLRGLADSIEYLSSKQELTAGEMALLEHQIAELNRSVPGLSLAFCEQSGALNMATEAMNAYLEAAEQREVLNAMLEEQSRLQEDAIALERELMGVQSQREALEYQLANNAPSRRADRKALEDAITELITAENNYNAALFMNEQMQAAVAEGIEIHADVLRELEQTQYEAAKALAEVTAQMEYQAKKSAEWEQAQNEALEKISRAYEGFKESATNAFSSVSQASITSTQEMVDNLVANQEALARWSRAVAVLMESDLPPALIQPIIDGGKGMADQAEYMVENLDSIMETVAPLIESGMETAMEAAVNVIAGGEIPDSFYQLIDNVAEAILQNQGMEDALVSQIDTAFYSMKNTIASVGFDELGEDTIDGYLDGVRNKQCEIEAYGRYTGKNYLGKT